MPGMLDLVFVFCDDWQTTVVLSLITALLLVSWYKSSKTTSKYPDGPMTFPILGNLPQIIAAGDFVQFLEKYRKIYGNVYAMEMGGDKRVVISGSSTMHHLLNNNADFTSNRQPIAVSKEWQEQVKKNPGLIWAPYPDWKTIRGQTLTVLRHEGMGKALMESKILSEINTFHDSFIEPNIGNPIDIGLSITYVTMNIVYQMVAGKRYDYSDKELHDFNESSHYSMDASLRGAQIKNIPFIRYLPDIITGERRLKKADDYTVKVAKSWVESSKKRLHYTDEYNFLQQSLLLAQQKSGNGELLHSDDNLALIAVQLCGAGTDTTTNTIKWGLLYMMLYPHIQQKVRKEIKDVLGEKEPSMKDKQNLPYTDAAIHEVLRCSNISAIGLPHMLDKDLVVEGKTVPAGSELLFNMASLVWDSEIFPEPDQFKPERFLGEDGATLKSKMPVFGIGRRACPGESVARVEIFLFLVSILQRYRVSYPPNKKPSLIPFVGLIRCAQDYDIIFERD